MVVGSFIASCMLVNAQQRAHGGGRSDRAIISPIDRGAQGRKGCWPSHVAAGASSRSGPGHCCQERLFADTAGEPLGLGGGSHAWAPQQWGRTPTLLCTPDSWKSADSRTLACIHVPPVQSNDTVTEGQPCFQMIMLPGCPLLPGPQQIQIESRRRPPSLLSRPGLKSPKWPR